MDLRWRPASQIINSIVTVDFDDNEKITKLVEIWGGEDPSKGLGLGFLRRVNAVVVPIFVRVPKHARAPTSAPAPA